MNSLWLATNNNLISQSPSTLILVDLFIYGPSTSRCLTLKPNSLRISNKDYKRRISLAKRDCSCLFQTICCGGVTTRQRGCTLNKWLGQLDSVMTQCSKKYNKSVKKLIKSSTSERSSFAPEIGAECRTRSLSSSFTDEFSYSSYCRVRIKRLTTAENTWPDSLTERTSFKNSLR